MHERKDMAAATEPMIESWYRTPGGDVFEVVAIDEHDQTIGIQYQDGAVEEIDMDAWYGLGLTAIEPPPEVLSGSENKLDDESELYHGNFDDLDPLGFSDWPSANDDYD